MLLAPDEKVVIEAPFGLGPLGGTATLTTRRILLAGGDSEESVPLSALTSVRAAFARNISGAVWGLILLGAALAFAANYRALETSVNRLGMSIEKRMTDKTPEGEAYGRYLYIPLGAVWTVMLPLLGWGAYKLADGVIGETELAITTASGTLRRTGRGRREELLDFGAEAGRCAGR